MSIKQVATAGAVAVGIAITLSASIHSMSPDSMKDPSDIQRMQHSQYQEGDKIERRRREAEMTSRFKNESRNKSIPSEVRTPEPKPKPKIDLKLKLRR